MLTPFRYLEIPALLCTVGNRATDLSYSLAMHNYITTNCIRGPQTTNSIHSRQVSRTYPRVGITAVEGQLRQYNSR